MAIDFQDYSDYRTLLRDLYLARKKKQPNFSYRFIAAKAGFRSPGFFPQILQGKTNVSIRTALSLASVFKMKAQEIEYFENLVHFNQARNQADKQHYFRKCVALKKSKLKALNERQYEFFTKWYYAAVRELLGVIPFRNDYKELASSLVPAISVPEAREAVKLLERLNLIRRNADGIYERLDANITTGDVWQSTAITGFQLATLDLARRSYDLTEKELRAHSTLTLCISKGEFQWIKGELGSLRKRILEMAKNAPHPDRVYQLNINLFPLSRITPDA
jgi:uncharacterized protein (TIGR02147 family)